MDSASALLARSGSCGARAPIDTRTALNDRIWCQGYTTRRSDEIAAKIGRCTRQEALLVLLAAWRIVADLGGGRGGALGRSKLADGFAMKIFQRTVESQPAQIEFNPDERVP